MGRFKVDENLPIELSQLLRDAGHDAVTVGEESLRGILDEPLATICRSEQRTLITLDVGFSNVREFQPVGSPGFVVLRLRRQGTQHVLRALERVMSLFDSEPLGDRLWIVEETRVRIRRGAP